jgi:hypothetical protein
VEDDPLDARSAAVAVMLKPFDEAPLLDAITGGAPFQQAVV